MSIVINPISPTAFSVFGLPIRWYALAYIAAFVLGYFMVRALSRHTDNGLKLSKKDVDDLKSVSLFALFSSDGILDFLNNVSVGAALCFVPEDLLSEQERDKLRRYTVGQLLEKDEYTEQMGLFSALRDVAFGGLFPTLLEYKNGKYVAIVKDGDVVLFENDLPDNYS